MRKLFRIFGAVICALSSCLAGISVAKSETALDRGAELVRHIAACGQCHTPHTPEGAPIASLELAGGAAKKLPLGTIAAANITPDIETGIGSWSEREIANALRTGTRPDGTIIGPPMPIAFYRKISEIDALAIAKYLKSIAPVRHVVPKSVYEVPLPASYGRPVSEADPPSPSDKIAYGGYLANMAHCLLCHTPVANGRMDMSRVGAGGRQYLDDDGGIIVSANITSDKTDGIGNWSDEDIKKAITQGIIPYGVRLNSFMPSAYFSGMAPDDLDAIVAFLRTLKSLAGN
jgi:mono/diheme cytochrome c family protein